MVDLDFRHGTPFALMRDAANEPGGALPPSLLQAFLEESRDLLVVTDSIGTIAWSNGRFAEATGFVAGTLAMSLLNFAPAGPAGTTSRLTLAKLLAAPQPDPEELELRSHDGAPLWVEARRRSVGANIVWVLADVTRTHLLAEQSKRQGELLETAQEFGRIGIWERTISTGEGHWDEHAFRFWGIDPADGTPSYAEALERVHPEDRPRMKYADSIRRAGRYSQRYRVIHPDGRTRWIHSQWEVKNGVHGVPDRSLGIMMDDTEAYEAARALVDASAQLQMAVELGKIAIWRHDLRTQRMYYSDRAFEVLGLAPRPEGFSIEQVRSFIHPDDLPLVLASAERALQSNRPTDMEARYRRADGSWRYVLTRRVVERSNSGEPIAFLGVALDLTERVEDLRQKEELARRFDAASRAARVGIWTLTREPPESHWNSQMFALFDRHSSVPPTLSAWIRESVHADDRLRVGRAMGDYLRAGDGPVEVEFRVVRRDGGIRWIVIRADVDRSQGDGRRLLGVALDVTEQHEAIEALRTASQRAALITHHAGIGTWEAAFDGSPEHWDEQMFRLRGLEPAPAPPPLHERLAMVHPDDAAAVREALSAAADAGLSTAYEFRVRLPDHSYRWLASRSAIVFDELGQAVRRVGVDWDITENKNAALAQQQAALAEKGIQAKSQFLSRMSHELRTPLNAVLGFTQLLQIEAGRAGQEEHLAKLEHIRAAGDHLLSLINDVLDLSALESGELRLSLRPVDVGQLVHQSLPLLHSLAAQHGVSLETGNAEGSAHADPTRLRQVLINLVSNAIKYNRRGGSVLVETGTVDDEALLVVRDTGRGLNREQIDSLFEPFNRFGVEDEGIEGTGIGLTIVRALVDGMHGRIEVSSEPGEGTEFIVRLPAAGSHGASHGAAAVVDDAAVEDESDRQGTILYIEDNAVNVLLVEELVRSVGGLRVVSELTGASGVARAASLQPDLVLIDLQLPDFDGYEVLRRLRAEPRTRDLPCIALSANAMPDDVRRGIAAGFADYWTKPIDFSIFLAALKKRFPGIGEAAPVQEIETSPVSLR
ncbi:MAG TPA: PAS domain-containing protein [Caldimonas sp.]|nr:PAS domain-containing protein [Caldimonas sp.]HEX2541895.1 PAS domain-containing protein [Caldimonas sp.]